MFRYVINHVCYSLVTSSYALLMPSLPSSLVDWSCLYNLAFYNAVDEVPRINGVLLEMLSCFPNVWVALAAVMRAQQYAFSNVDGSHHHFMIANLSRHDVDDLIFCLSRKPLGLIGGITDN